MNNILLSMLIYLTLVLLGLISFLIYNRVKNLHVYWNETKDHLITMKEVLKRKEYRTSRAIAIISNGNVDNKAEYLVVCLKDISTFTLYVLLPFSVVYAHEKVSGIPSIKVRIPFNFKKSFKKMLKVFNTYQHSL